MKTQKGTEEDVWFDNEIDWRFTQSISNQQLGRNEKKINRDNIHCDKISEKSTSGINLKILRYS
jgi:regulatory protein YycI of two-component signal transduction system YycFG